jgi:hypothetical protein
LAGIVKQFGSKAKARKSSCCGDACATACGSEVGAARPFVYVEAESRDPLRFVNR